MLLLVDRLNVIVGDVELVLRRADDVLDCLRRAGDGVDFRGGAGLGVAFGAGEDLRSSLSRVDAEDLLDCLLAGFASRVLPRTDPSLPLKAGVVNNSSSVQANARRTRGFDIELPFPKECRCLKALAVPLYRRATDPAQNANSSGKLNVIRISDPTLVADCVPCDRWLCLNDVAGVAGNAEAKMAAPFRMGPPSGDRAKTRQCLHERGRLFGGLSGLSEVA